MKYVLEQINADTDKIGHGWIKRSEYDAAGSHFKVDPQELFKINSGLKNGDYVGAMLTEKAKSILAKPSVREVRSEGSKYVIEDSVPMPDLPERRRGSGLVPRKSEYPLDSMNIGNSFVAPKRDDGDEPIRRMASIISAANRRMYPKLFKVLPDIDSRTGEYRSDGARVFRLPDSTEPLREPKPRKPRGSAAGSFQPPAATQVASGGFAASPAPAPFGSAAFGAMTDVPEFGAQNDDDAPMPPGFGAFNQDE